MTSNIFQVVMVVLNSFNDFFFSFYLSIYIRWLFWHCLPFRILYVNSLFILALKHTIRSLLTIWIIYNPVIIMTPFNWILMAVGLSRNRFSHAFIEMITHVFILLAFSLCSGSFKICWPLIEVFQNICITSS